MAVPADFTTLNLSGKFQLNKTLSDDPDVIFKEQGVNWFMRKALGISNIYLDLNHYKDDNGVEHIDSICAPTGGILPEREMKALDWMEDKYKSNVYGAVLFKARRLKVEELEIEHLANGWSEDTVEHGIIHIFTESDSSKNKNKWNFDQAFGIDEIDGERRYAVHVYSDGSSGNEIVKRFVYDYCGPL